MHDPVFLASPASDPNDPERVCCTYAGSDHNCQVCTEGECDAQSGIWIQWALACSEILDCEGCVSPNGGTGVTGYYCTFCDDGTYVFIDDSL